MFLRDFTDRRPTLSAVIIFLLYTVASTALYLGLELLFGGAVNSAAVVFVYALVIELALCLSVDRPILAFMPFLIMLCGFIASEIIYTVSMGMNAPGNGPGAAAFLISSAIVTVFGAEAAGILGAFLCFLAITVIKKLVSFIKYR